MNILYQNQSKLQLESAANEVDLFLTTICPLYTSEKNTIYLATWDEVNNESKKWGEEGFGFLIPNHYFKNNFIRLIVINDENCHSALLTKDEFKAVLLHEIGHILNHPPDLLHEPNLGECVKKGINKAQRDEILFSNQMKKEIFADAFVNINGFQNQLITSFQKYRNLFQKNVGFYEHRLAALIEENVYVGVVRQIDTNGF